MRRITLLLTTMALTLVVAAGVALAATITCTTNPCVGTPGDDRIKGSNGDEHIFGLGGNDTIDGNDGSDIVVGDDNLDPSVVGEDKLDGGTDSDQLFGYGGSDTFLGGPGKDKIDAESFETTEVPGTHNTIRAGSGDDDIYAHNGVQDSIDCGSGSELRGDSALVDIGLETVAKNCEQVL